MPSDRTTVTELGTGLGMLGMGDIEQAVRSRSSVMHSLSPETWQRLSQLRAGGAYNAEFHAAWENGRTFLSAADGLRGRRPQIVEWKGTGRAPGDEVAPIDLRVDHVYLVSCKYLSDILFNVSPAHVFDSLLTAGHSRRGRPAAAAAGDLPGAGDWYAEVAPAEFQALYAAVRSAAERGEGVVPARPGGPRERGTVVAAKSGLRDGAPALPGLAVQSDAGLGAETTGWESQTRDPPSSWGSGRSNGAGAMAAALRALPQRATDLTSKQRDLLGQWLRPGWPVGVKDLYVSLSDAVARASVHRWEAAMDAGGTSEAMLWRLLRVGNAPYFVLGSSAERSLRLRIATSWDWRQHFKLAAFSLAPQRGGQPRVGWQAIVRDRASSESVEVMGHIEVRWSHGRFGGLPEAKGYLDTPHHLVPGYFALR